MNDPARSGGTGSWRVALIRFAALAMVLVAGCYVLEVVTTEHDVHITVEQVEDDSEWWVILLKPYLPNNGCGQSTEMACSELDRWSVDELPEPLVVTVDHDDPHPYGLELVLISDNPAFGYSSPTAWNRPPMDYVGNLPEEAVMMGYTKVRLDTVIEDAILKPDFQFTASACAR